MISFNVIEIKNIMYLPVAYFNMAQYKYGQFSLNYHSAKNIFDEATKRLSVLE